MYKRSDFEITNFIISSPQKKKKQNKKTKYIRLVSQEMNG